MATPIRLPPPTRIILEIDLENYKYQRKLQERAKIQIIHIYFYIQILLAETNAT